VDFNFAKGVSHTGRWCEPHRRGGKGGN